MRIGIISYDFYPHIGGQGVEAYELHKQLQTEEGVEVVAFSSRKNNLKNHVTIPTLTSGEMGFLFFMLPVNLSLNKMVRKYSLDLVQVYGGPGGVFLFRKPHAYLICVANHTYAQQYRYLKRPVYKVLMRLEKRGYQLADKIIAISSATKQSLVEDYAIYPEKVEVILPGVDTGTFRPEKKVAKIAHSVLFVGRLHERKAIPSLILSLKEVRTRVPDVKLFIVGDGSLRVELQRLVAAEGLVSQVNFLGRVPAEELVQWYNRAEVFVLPSLFEGFGIVCLEAMACATPVIATMVPGVVDLVKDGETGLLVPPQNRKRLGEAIAKLLEDSELRNRLGNNGHQMAREKLDWHQVSRRFVAIYRRALR